MAASSEWISGTTVVKRKSLQKPNMAKSIRKRSRPNAKSLLWGSAHKRKIVYGVDIADLRSTRWRLNSQRVSDVSIGSVFLFSSETKATPAGMSSLYCARFALKRSCYLPSFGFEHC